MAALRVICVLAVLVLVVRAFSGCGNSDPLARNEQGTAPAAPAESVPAPTPVPESESDPPAQRPEPPAPPDFPLHQTQAGPLPEELAVTIRTAADALARGESAAAFEQLIDPDDLSARGATIAEIAKELKRIHQLLFECALREALTTEPRLNAEGTFVLFPLSDTTHLRFNRVNGRWRLSNLRPPSRETPGIGYDDAAKHAGFLLRKLEGIEPLAEEPWDESERPIVEALRRDGAGFAIGSKEGKPISAVVLNQTFRGSNESFVRLKSLASLRIVALYEPPLGDDALAAVGEFSSLTALRVIRPQVSDRFVESVARLSQLRHLRLNAAEKGPVSLEPLEELKALEQCELANLAFLPKDIAALQALPELRRLDLSESTVDDATLEVLGDFPKLESVRIPTNEATADGVAALRARVPNLFIDW